MKIVPKLTIAMTLGACAIFSVNAYLRVRRETAFFEEARIHDHELIGRSLGSTVTAVWRSDGQESALQTLQAADLHSRRLRIHWVTTNVPVGPALEPVTRVERHGESQWYTYVPIDIDGIRRGAIELFEPGRDETVFTRGEVGDAIAIAIALALMSSILAFVLGQWLVGRPVRALTHKARRIGLGDFAGPVMLSQRDELGDLAIEMNAMADRLSTTLDQLRHSDRLATVGKLAAGVAHELGTPLNVVSARATMIERTGRLDDAREYARIIDQAVGRMTNIIKQLLQFARRQGPKKRSRDLRQLVVETIDLLETLARKRSVTLALETSDHDTNVDIDPALLQQVVTNLVINAIQAIPSGGVVDLAFDVVETSPPDSSGHSSRYLRLSVTDDGPGVPAEILPHVFEPFVTTKDVGEGTGLGLAVSYGIVRDHNGWIAVENNASGGATFSVFLPMNVGTTAAPSSP